MGRRSKMTTRHLQNLCSTLPKVQKTTIEEILDAGDPDYLPMLEDGDSSKEGNDKELSLDFIWDEDEDKSCSESDKEFEAQIKNEATLLTFAQTLKNAQSVAVTAERKKNSKGKCLKHYTGHSIRSKQPWAEK